MGFIEVLKNLVSHPSWQSHCTTINTSSNPPTPHTVVWISKEGVCRVFRKQKTRKATCPDGVLPACLKTFADQLAFIFSQIFNRSLEMCEVPNICGHEVFWDWCWLTWLPNYHCFMINKLGSWIHFFVMTVQSEREWKRKRVWRALASYQHIPALWFCVCVCV